MKLIYAIIRYDNEDDVTTSLTKHKFSVTRLSTTGGFLKKGNTTLMIVTEPERVDEAIDIIKKARGVSVFLPRSSLLPLYWGRCFSLFRSYRFPFPSLSELLSMFLQQFPFLIFQNHSGSSAPFLRDAACQSPESGARHSP